MREGIFFIAQALLALPALSVSADEETPQSLLATTTTQADLTLLYPEIYQIPLPKLVVPPAEPPMFVHLPELVIKSDEWRGVL